MLQNNYVLSGGSVPPHLNWRQRLTTQPLSGNVWVAVAGGKESSGEPAFQPRSHTFLLLTADWLEPTM